MFCVTLLTNIALRVHKSCFLSILTVLKVVTGLYKPKDDAVAGFSKIFKHSADQRPLFSEIVKTKS